MARNAYLPTTPCTKCGAVHDRCGSHAKSTGKACNKWPEKGNKTCKMHGQNGRSNKAAAKRVVETELNRKLAEYWSDSADVTPTSAYQRALAIVDGNVAALPQVVQDVPEDKIAEMLEWATGLAAQSAKVAGDGIRAGIAERAVAVTEEQHKLLGEAIVAGMGDLGLGDRVPELLAAIQSRIVQRGAAG